MFVVVVVVQSPPRNVGRTSVRVSLYACRFLTTVERHLKNVTFGVGFQVVIETIPPMMNALRMVWIVSKHYNTDEKVNG